MNMKIDPALREQEYNKGSKPASKTSELRSVNVLGMNSEAWLNI